MFEIALVVAIAAGVGGFLGSYASWRYAAWLVERQQARDRQQIKAYNEMAARDRQRGR